MGPPLTTKQCEEDYTRDSNRMITLLTSRGKEHLSIERDLYEGLPHVSPELQYLWVDAICINQNDFADRSIQVQLMGSIYADANSVFVWLGLDESNVEDYKWIHETFYAALKEYVGKNDLKEFAWTSEWDSTLADSRLRLDTGPRWHGYSRLIEERRWFRCHSLFAAREAAAKDDRELEELYAYAAGSFEPKTDQPWRGDSELERWHGYALFVIAMLRFYEATVPHDMVYGMLGLLERQCPPDYEPPILVDYEQSPRDLYTSTAFYFIKHTASLVALSLAGEPEMRLRQDLPSWVLDFSSPPRSGVLSMQFIEGRPWNACGICVGSPGLRKLSGATLELEGAYFDEVTDVTSEGWKSEPTLATLQFLEESLHIVGTPTTYSKPPIELLAEVLLYGVEIIDASPDLLELLGTNTEEDIHASTLKESGLFFRGWACAIVVIADNTGASYESVLVAMQALEKQDSLSPGTLFSTEMQETINAVKAGRIHPEDPDLLRVITTVSLLRDAFIIQAIKNFLFQKLYRTSKGYVGFGKSTMQVGDQVWMLCDGRTPFILRPARERRTYTFIGETYLHRCMQGEMITEEPKARIRPVYLV